MISMLVCQVSSFRGSIKLMAHSWKGILKGAIILDVPLQIFSLASDTVMPGRVS